MRKHFLVLMLMALLPLAGWAEDLTGNEGVIVAAADIEYGQATHGAGAIRVTLDGGEITNTYWDVEGYYETADCSGASIDLNTLPVGSTRYVKIQFKGAYSGYAVGSFEVKKAVLKVLIKNNAYFTKVYKSTAANPALVEGDVVGKLRAAEEDITEDDYLTINVTKLNAYTFTGENVSAEGYPITFPADAVTLKAGLSADNYDLQIEPRTMKITAAAITGGSFTFNVVDNANKYPVGGYTYNAVAQRPDYTISWNHDDDAETAAITLVEGTDFTVSFQVGGDDVDNTINAGDYDVTVTGIGNYSGSNDAGDAFDFTIKRAPLTVMALPKTKVYDGAAYAVGEAQFNVSGRVGADASKAVTLLAATEVDAFASAVASYTVGVNTATAKIGDDLMSKNYDITPVQVEWEITKRPVILTVGNAEMNVGAAAFPALPAATAEAIGENRGAIDDTEAAAIVAAYTVKLLNGVGETYETGLANAATAAVGTYNEAYNATAAVAPTNYEVTVVKGNLTVKGADFSVMPVIASDIEYGDAYTIGYYTTGTIDESQLVFVIGETEYQYSEKATWELPTAVANYNVTIKTGTAVGIETSTGGTPTLLASSFNIVPRKLTLTVKPQTIHKNDPTTIIDELTAGNDGADGITITEDLAFDDEIEDLNLTYSLDDAVVTIAGGKVTSAAGVYADAILVALGNTNYELAGGAYTKGQLTISDDFTADLAAATAAATITEAANNGSKYNVTISGRTLTADTWNVMVLPFAVKPLDFCNAIGTYAVFNRLNKVEKGATDVEDKIYFKLVLDEIPANEPFLVKPLAAVDFDADEDENGVKDHIIPSVTFVDAEPTYIGVTGANFIGTYAASAATVDNFWALQGGVFKHFSSAKTIKFTRAYIELTSGASEARFFVEEPGENGATAIKSLDYNTMKSVDMDGWYTIGGVKLQGAPAQKGVYIRNGKKVVLK